MGKIKSANYQIQLQEIEKIVQNNKEKGKLFYTLDQVSQLFGFSTAKVYYLIYNYKLDAIKIRHYLRISYESILEYLWNNLS